MKRLTYLKDATTLALDEAACNGCRTCETVCPHGVLKVSDKKAHIGERDDCMECGACALNCKQGALTVRAGVGCAAAVINGMLNRDAPCC